MGISSFSLLSKQDNEKKFQRYRNKDHFEEKANFQSESFFYVVRANDKYHWDFDIMIHEL